MDKQGSSTNEERESRTAMHKKIADLQLAWNKLGRTGTPTAAFERHFTRTRVPVPYEKLELLADQLHALHYSLSQQPQMGTEAADALTIESDIRSWLDY